MKKYIYYCVLVCLLQPCFTYALDVIHYNKTHAPTAQRDNYPLVILSTALEKTKPQYGDYLIEFSPLLLKRNRALRALQLGEKLNVYAAPSRKKWEDVLTPIYFPIYKGLLSYRRLLINKDDQHKFKKINNIDQLKVLKAGLGQQWSTTEILRKNKFNVITSSSYKGLFGMLNLHRFDYLTRDITKVYYEFEARESKFPDMVIEDTIVLNIPLPIFLFVSPTQPRLKQRIEDGLSLMQKDGSFDELFNKYYATKIKKTDIAHKKVFFLENNQIKEHPIYNNDKLWINLEIADNTTNPL